MAHAATLKKLAEDLVTSTTSRSPGDSGFNRFTERTLRSLKDHNYARTNQFAIKARLDGLVEKFAVLGRDGLATAIETDLDDLPKDHRWMPEVLSLLLELSDRPVEKTTLEDVEQATGAGDSEKSLTWEEIIGDEPFDDPDIWADVERGYHSSGDDEFNHDLESDPTISTKATSLDENDPVSTARLYLSHPNETSLEHIRMARDQGKSLNQRDGLHEMSELVVVRETLSMMHGLPTDLFDVSESGQVGLSADIRIKTASSSSLLDLLNAAAETGSSLNFLRQWVPNESHSYLQAIHGAIEKQILSFGASLGNIEQQYVTPIRLVSVSALEVHTKIDALAIPLLHLSAIVERASGAEANPFALLNELYGESILAHMAGDSALFDALVVVFLAGLSAYLRSVAIWITRGTLLAQDRDILFVNDLDQECKAEDLWRLRFEMKLLPEGTAFTPECISTKANALFALGKSRAFLNRLDGIDEMTEQEHAPSSLPAFDECLRQIADNRLAPFSQLLEDTIDAWISEISTDCSPVLRSKLFKDHELIRTLDALPTLFFSQDGILFEEFADSIIERISKDKKFNAVDNHFLLNELAHSTIGSSHQIRPESIYLSVVDEKGQAGGSSLIRRLATFKLGYRLSWPVQNVMRPPILDALSKVFAFLLQIYSSSILVRGQFLDLRSHQPGPEALLKLRQTLLWFSNLLFDYTTKTAHVLHKDMTQAMERAGDIDEIAAVLARYDKRLQANLLLAPNLEPVRDAVIGILDLSEILSKTTGEHRIATLQRQFEQNLRFLIAGIRGVGRAGGESFLESLAETLEWGVH